MLVDLDHLPHGATLPDGTPCAAVISVIVGTRHAARYQPLALARTRRLATPAQWDALIARDRDCLRCGRAPRSCQAHHIIALGLRRAHRPAQPRPGLLPMPP